MKSQHSIMPARRITTSGAIIAVEPADGKRFKLGEIQKLVGSSVHGITLPNGELMFLDEDGKTKQKPPNPAATQIFNGHFPRLLRGMILGNVVIISSKMWRM